MEEATFRGSGVSLRVALLIETSREYGRKLLRGIAGYVQHHGPWVLHQEEWFLDEPLRARLRDWRPDGVIARVATSSLARQLRGLGVPVVDLYREDQRYGLPGVLPDQCAVVRLAAEHFLDRGFRHFAYCGFPGVLFSSLRQKFLAEYLAHLGHKLHAYAAPSAVRCRGLAGIEACALDQAGDLAQWLSGLPRPVGLLACNDIRARHVLDACLDAKITVPDEIAVLGVDNDDMLCELCNPPLSSIDLNAERIGHDAAALLHGMIQGEPAPRAKLLIEPAGIVTRRSTDLLAIADREIAVAIRYLREHACEEIDIDDLAVQLKVSRSTLGRWCSKSLGRSPSEEITRIRLNRVRELLVSTVLPMERIARLTGFPHVESLFRLFKQVTGQTPGQYRRELQSMAKDVNRFDRRPD
jgi:LacI family transcriptional regulator